MRHRADALGFTEGARWTEGAVGTNAIGTALAEDAPVQIFSAEHFVRSHHGWTCTACPVHDPRSGELLGVVDVSGPGRDRAPDHRRARRHGREARRGEPVALPREAGSTRCAPSAVPVLAAASAPGLVVDDHGWVAAVRGLPHLDRVADADRGRAGRGARPGAVRAGSRCPAAGCCARRASGAHRAAAHPRARRASAARGRRRYERVGAPAVDPARRGAPAAGPCGAHRDGRGRAQRRRSTATSAAS